MKLAILLPLLLGCPKHAAPMVTRDQGLPPLPDLPTDPSWFAVGMPGGPSTDLVLACTDILGPAGNDCPVPACSDDGCPEAPALVIGVSELAEGPVAIPVSQGLLAWERPGDGCDNVVVTADGAEQRWWSAGRRVVAVPTDAALPYAPEGTEIESVLAVDLDGDGVDEWIVSGEQVSGAVTGIVRDGAWETLLQQVRVEVPEDATEQERWEAEYSAWSGEVVGLTDAGLDGQLDLVVYNEGYEYWGYALGAIGPGGWQPLGKAGCGR